MDKLKLVEYLSGHISDTGASLGPSPFVDDQNNPEHGPKSDFMFQLGYSQAIHNIIEIIEAGEFEQNGDIPLFVQGLGEDPSVASSDLPHKNLKDLYKGGADLSGITSVFVLGQLAPENKADLIEYLDYRILPIEPAPPLPEIKKDLSFGNISSLCYKYLGGYLVLAPDTFSKNKVELHFSGLDMQDSAFDSLSDFIESTYPQMQSARYCLSDLSEANIDHIEQERFESLDQIISRLDSFYRDVGIVFASPDEIMDENERRDRQRFSEMFSGSKIEYRLLDPCEHFIHVGGDSLPAYLQATVLQDNFEHNYRFTLDGFMQYEDSLDLSTGKPHLCLSISDLVNSQYAGPTPENAPLGKISYIDAIKAMGSENSAPGKQPEKTSLRNHFR